MAEPSSTPTGTVTFLFTDVEGSTELWERDQEGMERALERHDEILRSAIGEHRGYVFSTAGDAFAAAFHDPADALGAAVSAQEGLERQRLAGSVTLRVRMGVHSGTAHERGGDYFGPTLNRCARLMAAAHGGQIVVSAVTAGMVADASELEDLGEHRLKDLATPMRVFQLSGEGRGQPFPPLRSLPTDRTNLPFQSDSFIGRSNDIERIRRQLEESRLVSLSALGGTGKTRLAVHVGAELLDSYRDGVWFVEVDQATSASEVGASIGRVLGFQVRDGSNWVESAADWLSVKELLLILDNCEHVADGVAEVVQAVMAASRSQILVTSREPLRVRGEAVVSLAPLDPGGEAVELFVERATRWDDRFEPDHHRSAIGELCRRLDGLPLAIELAAARIRTVDPDDLVRLLDRRFELLRSRERGAPSRHETLLATLEWSYLQLPEPARALFERLSVFGAPFSLDAVVSVAGDRDELTVLDLLDELESLSLIDARRSGHEVRYALLETLSTFAADRLADRGVTEEVVALHARHYLEKARDLLGGIEQVDVDTLADRLGLMNENLGEIRQSLRWALDHEPDTAAQVARDLLAILVGLREFRRASQLITDFEEGLAPHDNSGVLLSFAAMAHWGEGDIALMEQLAGQALAGPTAPEAAIMAHTAFAAVATVWRSEPERGLIHLEEAAAFLPDAPDTPAAAFAVGGLAVQFYQAGRPDRCREIYLAHLEPKRTTAALWDIVVLEAAADAWRFDDLEVSSDHLRRALDVAARVGLGSATSFSRFHLALNDRMARRYQSAFQHFRDCLRELLNEGEVLAGRLAMEDLAAVLSRVGRFEDSLICLGAGTAGLGHDGGQGSELYVRRRRKITEEARGALDDEATQDALSRGAAMTIDEAVDWAASLEWDDADGP